MFKTIDYVCSPFVNDERKMEILKQHLFIYLGNKRKIIPYIDQLICQIRENDKSIL